MNRLNKLTILFLIAVFSLVVFAKASPVSAYMYNGEEEGAAEIYIDKSVSMPREGNEGDLIFKDNLGDSVEERYLKDQIVVFELRVKNTGDKTVNKVTVRDRFPEYVDFPGDDENWDDDAHTYTYEITDLEAGEEDIRTIEGRVTTDARICVVNRAEAEPDEGDSDTDTAGFCIGQEEGEVLGVAEMPETGMNPVFAFGALAIAGIGALMKKKE